MATLTLTVPEDLKHELEDLKVVDWPEVAREALRLKVAQLRILSAISSKSKLTEKEAIQFSVELGRKVRQGIHQRHVEKYGV